MMVTSGPYIAAAFNGWSHRMTTLKTLAAVWALAGATMLIGVGIVLLIAA
jgi:hypothetical protein